MKIGDVTVVSQTQTVAGLSHNSCVLSRERGKMGRCKYNQVDNSGKAWRNAFLVIDSMCFLSSGKIGSKSIIVGIENSKA